MTTRAKFVVQSVTTNISGHNLVLVPVTGGSEENKSFFKWTPTGRIEMGVINPDIANSMTPGKEYYIDFTEVTNENKVV